MSWMGDELRALLENEHAESMRDPEYAALYVSGLELLADLDLSEVQRYARAVGVRLVLDIVVEDEDASNPS